MGKFQICIKCLLIISIVVICLRSVTNCSAQNYNETWPLGHTPAIGLDTSCNLRFTNGNMFCDTVARKLKFIANMSSICDSIGQLLFYTNGCSIGRDINDTMQNGQSISSGVCPSMYCSNAGNVVEQGSIILPFPGQISKFLVLNSNCSLSLGGNPDLLEYDIVDMSLDSGRGSVIHLHDTLLNRPLAGPLSAVKHANGEDWWLFAHTMLNDTIVSFLITGNGIQGPYFQAIGSTYSGSPYGNCRFSPDGNWFAISEGSEDIDVFNFDRCTGMLTNRIWIDLPDTLWGTFSGI
ncbi:MAG: hypothetical protein IPP51_00105 [Bacteroidetes bacterium]|nr:hypothetical protein [Bacteroidota bacterium]